jgi:2-dehydropantoate 2-reductase
LSIHFIQNAGLHTQSLKLGSLAELAGKPRNVREAILATRELLPLAEARGVDLRRHRGDVLPFTAPVCLAAPVLTWLFGHFPPMRTVMEAHANPEELRAVCRDTLAEARRLGVSVPRLEAAEPYFAAERNT